VNICYLLQGVAGVVGVIMADRIVKENSLIVQIHRIIIILREIKIHIIKKVKIEFYKTLYIYIIYKFIYKFVNN